MSRLSRQTGLRSMESNHKPLVVLRCKLVIVGDACVGKSAITQVFQSGGATFPKNYVMTIGAEFCVVQVPIPETDAIVELYIYDCAGQSIFNQIEMNAKYYDNAAAVLVVYDVTNRDTIKSCIKWVEDVRTRRGGAMAPIIGAVVGNKCEFRDGTIESRADVIKEDANRLAADLGCAYFECSAANNIAVDVPFKHIATEFYKRYQAAGTMAEELSSGLNF